MQNDLVSVLDAREVRWNLRKQYASLLSRGCVITATFCMPHQYRISADIHPLFIKMTHEIEELLHAANIPLDRKENIFGQDGPAAFWTSTTSPNIVKKYCVQAEETLLSGRLLDIDLMDINMNPIGRSDVGLPPRKCFVCDEMAAVCVAGRKHSATEVSIKVESMIAAAH